jgi:hypothetical protein
MDQRPIDLPPLEASPLATVATDAMVLPEGPRLFGVPMPRRALGFAPGWCRHDTTEKPAPGVAAA